MSEIETIRASVANIRATLRGMLSDDAVSARIDLKPEIEECDQVINALDALEVRLRETERERDELRQLCAGYASDADLYADELYKAGWSDPAWQGVSPKSPRDDLERSIARAEAAEAQVAALREALTFTEQAMEEVLELEEPAAEIADVATSAARTVLRVVRAALSPGGER